MLFKHFLPLENLPKHFTVMVTGALVKQQDKDLQKSIGYQSKQKNLECELTQGLIIRVNNSHQ